MAWDFLIVGAGIGGAVLANLLGRRGKRVLVIEKSLAPAPQTRPEILWPATVAFLRTLLPVELERRWLLPVEGASMLLGDRPLVHIGPEVLQAAGVQPYSTAHTRELLMERAPCDFLRGLEVTQVFRDGGRVRGVRVADATGASRDLLADWTVGDDGARSAVRRGCGLPMSLVRFPVELLGFSFTWPEGLAPNRARVWLNRERRQTGLLGMAVAPLPGGKGAALIPGWPEILDQPRRVQRALRSFAAQEAMLGRVLGGRAYPQDFTRFRLAWARRPCFGAPGVLLLGDAAHPVTPVGGQGANASVADARVIAEAALERPDTLLAEYRSRRREATGRSLALSRGAARLASLPRPLVSAGLVVLPWAARWLNDRPHVFGRFLCTAAEAFRE